MTKYKSAQTVPSPLWGEGEGNRPALARIFTLTPALSLKGRGEKRANIED
ncbi:hypothetical protein HMPREF1608_01271 [Escherichia coli 908525]|nr:hypothetical protein HMPREF1608_01271 [Escherichia coli 908525]